MKFIRRDAILVAGTAMFVMGMIPFMAPIIAIGIGACIFFAIKSITARRQGGEPVPQDTASGQDTK